MITTNHNQLLVDVAMQLQGDAAGMFVLAVAMGVGVTDDISAGTEIEATGVLSASQKAIAAQLSKAINLPASGDGLAGLPNIVGSFVQLLPTELQTGNRIEHGQCLVDMAMQYNGDAAMLFSLATSLGIGITDDLTPGDFLTINADLTSAQKAIAAQLSKTINLPASGDGLAGLPNIVGSFVQLLPTEIETGNRIEHGQCLVDMAMQYNGDAAMLFSLATSLDLSITEVLTAGDYLDIMAGDLPAAVRPVVKLLNKKDNIPASYMDNDGPPLTVKLEGIDYWYVYEYVVQ